MTRVLHLTRDFPPRCTGGISTAVGGMVRASEGPNLTCAVLSFDAWRPQARSGPARAVDPPPQDAGPPVLRLMERAQLPAARAFATSFRPELLHVHDGMLWELGAELRADLGAPAVFSVHVAHAHQNHLRDLGETLSLAAQRRALREADVVIAPSKVVARLLVGEDATLGHRLHVIGLGVDDDERARRAATGGGRDQELVLCVGRFSDLRGTLDLFEAIPRILARSPLARFAVVGGVPENRAGEARWRRRWEAQPSEVRTRVELTGWLAPQRVRDFYDTAAILVVPSRFETFGQVALEGMLHGMAVVATTAGALPELLEHGETGLLSPPGDVDSLVENCVTLLTDPERTRQLGGAAGRKARRSHLWEHVMPELSAAYRACTRKP